MGYRDGYAYDTERGWVKEEPQPSMKLSRPEPPGWQESAEELSASRPGSLVLEVTGFHGRNKPWPIVWSKAVSLEHAFKGDTKNYLQSARKSNLGVTAYWGGNQVEIPTDL